MSIQLGTKLADLRKRNGYSQEALAEKMGISRQAVSKWERGDSTPDTDTLIELAKLYSVSLDTLVGNEQNEETKEPETGKKEKKQKEKKPPLYPGLSKKLLFFPFPMLVVVIYILLGFGLNLWHPAWLIFITIPAYYHIAIGMRATTKKGLLLSVPVIEAALVIFLILGLFINAWAWAWILFILAIFYYWSVAFYVRNDE